MQADNDKEIISLLKTQKSIDKAFTLLVSSYKQQLYCSIRRIVRSHEDSEDALQETLLRAYRHLPKFREESNIYTWLYRIATNEALRILEKREKQRKESLDKYMLVQGDKIWNAEADKINILLQKAIDTLPSKQKVVFTLRYFDELSYKDIEQITNISQNALKVSYHVAEKKIKEFITKQL